MGTSTSDKIQSIRGMKDLFGEDCQKWRTIEEKLHKLFFNYGFEEIRTPYLEEEALFKRSTGSSDIVLKEMYSFLESSAENAKRICLKPEGTASVVRALIQHKKTRDVPFKCYYVSPFFRHERPQKGRQRQFSQFGFETFGSSSSAIDAEGLLLSSEILKALKLKQYDIEVNSIGSLQDRKKYCEKLVEFFTPFKKDLSEYSQIRLEKNPLRILDSKNETDQQIAKSAPSINEFLGQDAILHWSEFLEHCELLGLSVKHNSQLVRGLDYYNNTVFEIKDTSGQLGAQSTLIAGGRYDKLVEVLGGAPTPAFGAAGGIERLLLLLEDNPEINTPKNPTLSLIVPSDGHAYKIAAKVIHFLRRKISVHWQMDAGKNMGKLMKKANKVHAEYCWILGDDEVTSGNIKIKNMSTGEERISELNGKFQSLPPEEIANLVIASL